MILKFSITSKAIFGLLGLICFFIIYEINYFKAISCVFSNEHYLLFYSFDIIYFLFGIQFYLPAVWIKISSVYYRFFAIVLFVVVYSFSYCLLGVFNQILILGKVRWGVTFNGVYIASYRGVFITLAIATYSFLRFTIIGTREIEKQKLLTIQAEKEKLEAEKEKLIAEKQKLEAEKLQLEAEKRAAMMENIYYQSQINPHLAFNSLSFIYRKAIVSDRAVADAIKLVADMMEYALHHNEEDGTVNLLEDAQYIDLYIELQQLLHANAYAIQFDKKISENGKPTLIPPLIFINFVENVFKYGNLDDSDYPAQINLCYDGSTIKFCTENKVQLTSGSKSNRVGIANAKARIQKHFGDHCEIKITDDNNLFKVEIKIEL